MRYIVAILSVFMLLGLGSVASAQSMENLRYDVSWGDATVATMKLDIGCKRGSHVPAALVARSTGVANQIHSFDVRLDSFFVPGGRSLEGRTSITEEGVPRRFKSRFKSAKRVRVEKKYKGKTTQKAFDLPGASHDLLSWMLHLRAKSMKLGATHKYWVWDGWKLSRIDAVVGEPQGVATKQGVKEAYSIKLFRTVYHHGGPDKFEPRGERNDLGTLWLGTDAARTPWAMTFDAPVGVAKVSLSSLSRRSCPAE